MSASLPASYFEGVYGANDDPWQYETSAYEHGKYARTLAALPRAHYTRAVEVGCSIGVLTEQLAARCDELLAIDVNATALVRTRARTAHLPGVRTRQMRLPDETPDGSFDLILLSEVGYYWSAADLDRVLQWAWDRLEPGGTLELVHWTHPVPDYPLLGDDVHAAAAAVAAAHGGEHLHAERHADYRLDVYAARSS